MYSHTNRNFHFNQVVYGGVSRLPQQNLIQQIKGGGFVKNSSGDWIEPDSAGKYGTIDDIPMEGKCYLFNGDAYINFGSGLASTTLTYWNGTTEATLTTDTDGKFKPANGVKVGSIYLKNSEGKYYHLWTCNEQSGSVCINAIKEWMDYETDILPTIAYSTLFDAERQVVRTEDTLIFTGADTKSAFTWDTDFFNISDVGIKFSITFRVSDSTYTGENKLNLPYCAGGNIFTDIDGVQLHEEGLHTIEFSKDGTGYYVRLGFISSISATEEHLTISEIELHRANMPTHGEIIPTGTNTNAMHITDNRFINSMMQEGYGEIVSNTAVKIPMQLDADGVSTGAIVDIDGAELVTSKQTVRHMKVTENPCLEFDGNAYGSLGRQTSLRTNDFDITVRVMFNNVTTQQYIMAIESELAKYHYSGFFLDKLTTGEIRLLIYTSSDTVEIYGNIETAVKDTWYTIRAVKVGANLKLYCNNNPVIEHTNANETIHYNSASDRGYSAIGMVFLGGAYRPDKGLNGKIDYAIFNGHKLTCSEGSGLWTYDSNNDNPIHAELIGNVIHTTDDKATSFPLLEGHTLYAKDGFDDIRVTYNANGEPIPEDELEIPDGYTGTDYPSIKGDNNSGTMREQYIESWLFRNDSDMQHFYEADESLKQLEYADREYDVSDSDPKHKVFCNRDGWKDRLVYWGEQTGDTLLKIYKAIKKPEEEQEITGSDTWYLTENSELNSNTILVNP